MNVNVDRAKDAISSEAARHEVRKVRTPPWTSRGQGCSTRRPACPLSLLSPRPRAQQDRAPHIFRDSIVKSDTGGYSDSMLRFLLSKAPREFQSSGEIQLPTARPAPALARPTLLARSTWAQAGHGKRGRGRVGTYRTVRYLDRHLSGAPTLKEAVHAS